MNRILVKYEPNADYYPEGAWYLTGEFVFDIDKLREFVAKSGDFTYSLDEAKQILGRIDSDTLVYGFDSHDKYSFFDTKCECEKVLSNDQTSPADYEITIYLNM